VKKARFEAKQAREAMAKVPELVPALRTTAEPLSDVEARKQKVFYF
jgi:hypothetical protein